jgi:hypothetical protein
LRRCVVLLSGAPGMIRTCDPRIRRTPVDSSGFVSSGHSAPASDSDKPRSDVMTGPCLNSVPFARAADAALGTYLTLMAEELAAPMLGARGLGRITETEQG